MNAYEYAKNGAAIVIEESNLGASLMASQLKSILNSPEKIDLMSKAAKSFAKPDAAEKIAEGILELAKI